MTAQLKLICAVTLLISGLLAQPNTQWQYNLGDMPSSLMGNPAFMNQAIGNVLSGSLQAACNNIPGVGSPILAIKKLLIAIDLHLDATNTGSFVKVIFFKETKTVTGLNVKFVALIKTFTDQFYAGVEVELRLKGTQRLRLINYIYDTDLEMIRQVLGETNINETSFIGCGDLKNIYTAFLKTTKKPEFLEYNIPYGQTTRPFVPPGNYNQPPTFGYATGNAPNGSQGFGQVYSMFGGQ